MLRWSEEQLREHHAKRQGRTEAMAEAKAHQTDAPRAKYRNKKTTIGDRVFDSKLEAARFVSLKRLQESKIISGLQCQVPFILEVNGLLVCKYVADFVYLDVAGCRVVEDAKGVRTRDYILKKKLMKAVHGIDVVEFRREPRKKKSASGANPV